MRPMISIIIPAYNSSATIVEALESVLAQRCWASELLSCSVVQLLSESAASPGQLSSCLPCIALATQGSVVQLLSESANAPSSLPSTTQQPNNLTTAPLYEVIIVDDCSTDDTVEVVRRWVEGRTLDLRLQTIDPSRVKPKTEDNIENVTTKFTKDTKEENGAGEAPKSNVYGLQSNVSSLWSIVSLPANAGPAKARNRGILEARGEWIAFLDADDLWTPEKIATQMALVGRHPQAAMFCGRPAPFIAGTHGETESEERHGRWGVAGDDRVVTLDELSEHNPVATSTVLVRRSVLESVGGFDGQFRGPEDYDLWLRVAARGAVYYSSAILSRYRYGDLSLSTDDRKFLAQVVRVVEKAYAPGGALEGMKGRRRALSYQHLAACWMASERGSAGRAWVLWCHAVWLWPFRYGPHSRLRWGRVKMAVRLLRSWGRKKYPSPKSSPPRGEERGESIPPLP